MDTSLAKGTVGTQSVSTGPNKILLAQFSSLEQDLVPSCDTVADDFQDADGDDFVIEEETEEEERLRSKCASLSTVCGRATTGPFKHARDAVLTVTLAAAERCTVPLLFKGKLPNSTHLDTAKES